MHLNLSQQEFNQSIKSGAGAVLFKQISADILTPVAAHLKISSHFPNHHFLLESAENSSNKGRFSVLGFMPDLVWKCSEQDSFINRHFLKNPRNFEKQSGEVLDNLRHLIVESKIDWRNCYYRGEAMPSICAGIFGYMGYDMVRLMENLPNRQLCDDLKIPDSIFIRPQILVIFDNLFDCALICAPLFANQADSYEELLCKIEMVEKILLAPLPQNSTENHVKEAHLTKVQSQKKEVGKSDQTKPDEFIGKFRRYCDKDSYCKMVDKAKEYITAGDIFQVLPSQRFVADYLSPKNSTQIELSQKELAKNEFDFYRALRSINPSPFLFYLKFDDFVLTGSSPEIMVSLKNRKMTIRPLAGTRKRGHNQEEDQKIAAELLADEKEIAEHLMLIDLGRNDVGMVAKPGTVQVTKKMAIEHYSHVMHISSTVEGILRNDCEPLDALIAGFPAGTVSGAPKIRAMEIIEEIEQVKRSFYSGCVGYFAGNGDMETCITLRSALIKDQKIYLQSGAGVVFDSNSEFENQECLNKAQVLMKAFDKSFEF